MGGGRRASGANYSMAPFTADCDTHAVAETEPGMSAVSELDDSPQKGETKRSATAVVSKSDVRAHPINLRIWILSLVALLFAIVDAGVTQRNFSMLLVCAFSVPWGLCVASLFYLHSRTALDGGAVVGESASASLQMDTAPATVALVNIEEQKAGSRTEDERTKLIADARSMQAKVCAQEEKLRALLGVRSVALISSQLVEQRNALDRFVEWTDTRTDFASSAGVVELRQVFAPATALFLSEDIFWIHVGGDEKTNTSNGGANDSRIYLPPPFVLSAHLSALATALPQLKEFSRMMGGAAIEVRIGNEQDDADTIMDRLLKVSAMLVHAARHLISLSGEFSPPRAVLLQLAPPTPNPHEEEVPYYESVYGAPSDTTRVLAFHFGNGVDLNTYSNIYTRLSFSMYSSPAHSVLQAPLSLSLGVPGGSSAPV